MTSIPRFESRAHTIVPVAIKFFKDALSDQGKFKSAAGIVIIFQCRYSSIVGESEIIIFKPEADHGNDRIAAAVIQTANQYFFAIA